MATPAMILALLDALYGVSIVTRVEVAAATLFLWDWTITLGMEVDLIWSSRWNVIKILYLVQRYLPMVDTCFLTLFRDLVPRTDHECIRIQRVTGFCYITGIAISELLLTFRVYAIWGQSRPLAYFLVVAFILVWSPAYIFMYFFSNSIKFFAHPPVPGLTGCFVLHANATVIGCWASLIVWNTITMALMLIPGWKAYSSRRSGANSNLAKIVYRDGTFYYIYLFFLSAANIILSLVAVPTRRFILAAMERCLHSMLASRVILHMRDTAKQPTLEWVGGEYSSGRIDFASANASVGRTVDLPSDQPASFKMKEFG